MSWAGALSEKIFPRHTDRNDFIDRLISQGRERVITVLQERSLLVH